MTPDIAGNGHSFMGAMAYYLHDKRQEQTGPHPQTADRVAWTETRNLAGVGPQTATRVMIDHAQQAGELKAAAGIASTGRKSNAHVYAFSLSWRHDEVDGLDRAEMVRATDAALKFLGADHLQAVLIAHRDREHPHVHVVLNRIEADGRMWNPSHSKNKFSQWANLYERENGKIVSPKRDEKWRKIEEGQKAHPDPEKRRAHVAKRLADTKTATKQRPPSRGQMLKELADAQKAQHRRDWTDWAEKAKAERKAIYDAADRVKAAAVARFKDSTRGDWAQHFRAERDRAAAFDQREQSLSGVVRNALAAAKQQFREQPQGGRGMLALTFSNVLDSTARRQTFDAAQELTRAQFTAAMKDRRDAHLVALELEKRKSLIDHSAAVDKAKADMIARQNIERDKMREAWRQHYASHETAVAGQTYRTRKPQPLPVKEPQPMKDQFDKARVAPANDAPRRHPSDDQRLSTPVPAPRPAGIVDPPHSEMKPVPVVDRSPPIEAKAAPSVRRDWKPAPSETPAEPTPAAKTGATDWAARAKQLRTEHGEAASPDQPTQRPKGPRMR